ncbi:hypothetical protein ACFFIX_11710 [Metabacillus herbersteinensis]|uniref:Uncharacterized protein n=1 Tax=Metabacillus herbersteinensis TaxID=283816 RepID=A0ABV6GEL4_9BACI
MFDAIDWRLITFISYSLFHEYIVHIRYPQIYYWNQAAKKSMKE